MEDRRAGAGGAGGDRDRHVDVRRRALKPPGRAEISHPGLRLHASREAALAGDASVAGLARLARDEGLALPDGRPLAFVAAPAAGLPARDYERSVAERAEIPTRAGNAHDRCNALAWLAFPRTKAALNAIHVAAPDAGTGNRRSRCRDAATLLDESGAIAACTDPEVVALWQAHAWRALFGERQAHVAATLAVEVIGHGLLAKLAAPYRALTAKALVVAVDARSLPAEPRERAARLDTAAAACIAALGDAFVPEALLPLPVAALPGWDTEALGAQLFKDVAVFRPPRE